MQPKQQLQAPPTHKPRFISTLDAQKASMSVLSRHKTSKNLSDKKYNTYLFNINKIFEKYKSDPIYSFVSNYDISTKQCMTEIDNYLYQNDPVLY